jgi:hypothetical protein
MDAAFESGLKQRSLASLVKSRRYCSMNNRLYTLANHLLGLVHIMLRTSGDPRIKEKKSKIRRTSTTGVHTDIPTSPSAPASSRQRCLVALSVCSWPHIGVSIGGIVAG